MHFEPILLEATLAAVLDWLALTLGTCVVWYKLLFYLILVFSTLLLLLCNFFQWAHLILTLVDAYHLVRVIMLARVIVVALVSAVAAHVATVLKHTVATATAESIVW